MAECNHDWIDKGHKYRCAKCGAGRKKGGENDCLHQWELRPSGKKEQCKLCGAARVTLQVHDADHASDSETIGG